MGCNMAMYDSIHNNEIKKLQSENEKLKAENEELKSEVYNLEHDLKWKEQ